MRFGEDWHARLDRLVKGVIRSDFNIPLWRVLVIRVCIDHVVQADPSAHFGNHPDFPHRLGSPVCTENSIPQKMGLNRLV